MIAALRGQLEHWDEDSHTLWLDVAGVTYEVLVPAFAAGWVATHDLGTELRLYTYYHVNERQPRPVLIGFPRLVERDFFRRFIEVPDVGPVRAVRALDRPVSEIARAIEGGDTKALQQLPGVGARTAQTIVAHLQGKLLDDVLLDAAGASFGGATEGARVPEAPTLRDDVIEALLALQYGRREAEQMASAALEANPDLEELTDLLRLILSERARA
jgi:Holliday junction DNA helicase RuvA